jgi:hypothetical protein
MRKSLSIVVVYVIVSYFILFLFLAGKSIPSVWY